MPLAAARQARGKPASPRCAKQPTIGDIEVDHLTAQFITVMPYRTMLQRISIRH